MKVAEVTAATLLVVAVAASFSGIAAIKAEGTASVKCTDRGFHTESLACTSCRRFKSISTDLEAECTSCCNEALDVDASPTSFSRAVLVACN